MQIVSLGDNLHEVSKPICEEKKKENYFKVSSAEFLSRVLSVKKILTEKSSEISGYIYRGV